MITARLRAIAERARRLSWANWLRMGIGYALGVAVMTLLAIAGWRIYAGWRTGRVELWTEGDPVVVQVLAEDSDTPIGEPFDLATRAVVELPDGDYRLRVDGKGRLGRTFRFAVNRGETLAHSISIDEGRLLAEEPGEESEPVTRRHERWIPFEPVTTALELEPGTRHFVQWSDRSLYCRDGRTGAVLWDALHPAQAFDEGRDPAPSIRSFSGDTGGVGSANIERMQVFERAYDFDGDGTGDVLCSFNESAAFVSLSGKDGSLLWDHLTSIDGLPRAKEALAESNTNMRRPARMEILLGEAAVGDLDGDGRADLVATIVSTDWHTVVQPPRAQSGNRQIQMEVQRYRRAIVAISGSSGLGLWRYAVDETPKDLPRRGSIPRGPALLVDLGGSPVVAYVDDTKWLGLDPATGKLRLGPIELGVVPERPVKHVDLDGDGEPEIVALGPGFGRGEARVSAISIKTGRELWAEDIDNVYVEANSGLAAPDYPAIVDLGGDGGPGIVVADSGTMRPGVGYRGVRMIDARTGTTRWRRPLRPQTSGKDGLVQIIAGPDLDGDGTRDVVTVSLFVGRNPPTVVQPLPEEPRRIYVDALSGRDGRVLWWWKVDGPEMGKTGIGKPAWWWRGSDGWPLLAVPLGAQSLEGLTSRVQYDALTKPNVHLLEASTGRERHRVTGLAQASFADLDGDGRDDLWGECDGELRAFRGEAPEAWRALGAFGPAGLSGETLDRAGGSAADLDGDGINDALTLGVQAPGAWRLQATGTHTALARSGSDGHLIWKMVIDPLQNWLDPNSGESYQLRVFPLPEGDFDRDGTPDLIVWRDGRRGASPKIRRDRLLGVIQVLSGRSGVKLWSAETSRLELESQDYWNNVWMGARAVERGGVADLFVRHTTETQRLIRAAGKAAVIGKPRLARISGRDGRLLWDVILEDQPSWDSLKPDAPLGFGEFDGDGGLDALFELPHSRSDGGPEKSLVALSLRDGRRLWSRVIRTEASGRFVACAGDIDGDSRSEVLVMEVFQRERTGKAELEVLALDGGDGKPKWTWNAGKSFVGDNEWQSMVLADFDGVGTRGVCATFVLQDGTRRVVVLDGNGRQRAARDEGTAVFLMFEAIDLDGDGRDELVAEDEHRVYVWDSALKDVWSRATHGRTVQRVLQGAHGEPGAVVIAPALWLDGKTGGPRWAGQDPLFVQEDRPTVRILDPGNLTQPPRFVEERGQSTVCRLAMATTPDGGPAAPAGKPVQARSVDDDPRWRRPLPWVPKLKGAFGPWGLVAAGGLALVNLGIPVFVLWLASGRRRSFRIRTLMALPIAAVIPLMGYLTIGPWLPVGSGRLLATEGRVFLAGTVGGVPVVLYTMWMVAGVIRRRWKDVLALAALTGLATFALAGGWIRFDRRTMAPIEHYWWEGWGLVAMAGGYVAAVLWGLGRGVLRGCRLARRREVGGRNREG